MPVDVDIAAPASLIGDPTRASFLLALTEKDALPLSELARLAGVSNSTASIHLGKLVDSGLLSVERHGRHRYFRLSDPAVATALDALAAIAPARPARSAHDARRVNGIRAARTCYDHLAGELGVSLLDGLRREGFIQVRDSDVEITPAGRKRLEALGIDLTPTRRPLTKLCLDWSERRYHLAGALGAALRGRLFELGWVERTGTGRAVRVTAKGREGLRSLGLQA
jgi:DNA-binding transcriptional ArsR family regulator